MENLFNWLANNADLVVCVGLVVLVLGYFGYGLYLKYTNFMRIQIEYKVSDEAAEGQNRSFRRWLNMLVLQLDKDFIILGSEGFVEQRGARDEVLNSNLYNVRRIIVGEDRLDVEYNNDEACEPSLVTPITVTYSPDGRDWLFRDKTLREETFHFTR